MLFNSYLFLFAFLPVTYVGYYVLARIGWVWAKVWLAAASLVFYAAWDVRFLPILLASILFNYAVGYQIAKSAERGAKHRARAWLVLGIVGDLGALAYFKYVNFFLATVNLVAGTAWSLGEILLPLGISFFTFTQIAYLVDAYQGKAREYRFADYALFVTYFPHLIVGPILHHAQMMPQFNQPATFVQDRLRFAVGIAIFTVGLFKKVALADRIAIYADTVFNAAAQGAPLTASEAWAGTLAYTLQLYFDFSGYSDMAVGLSLLFGIRMPLNFAAPLQSTSMIEMWQRWHMTLGRFLRDYLYQPIAGLGKNAGKGRDGAVRHHVPRRPVARRGLDVRRVRAAARRLPGDQSFLAPVGDAERQAGGAERLSLRPDLSPADLLRMDDGLGDLSQQHDDHGDARVQRDVRRRGGRGDRVSPLRSQLAPRLGVACGAARVRVVRTVDDTHVPSVQAGAGDDALRGAADSL